MAITPGSQNSTISLINQTDDPIEIYSDIKRTTLENKFKKSTGTVGEVVIITVYDSDTDGMYKVSKTVYANGKDFAKEGWYLYIPKDKYTIDIRPTTYGTMGYINLKSGSSTKITNKSKSRIYYFDGETLDNKTKYYFSTDSSIRVFITKKAKESGFYQKDGNVTVNGEVVIKSPAYLYIPETQFLVTQYQEGADVTGDYFIYDKDFSVTSTVRFTPDSLDVSTGFDCYLYANTSSRIVGRIPGDKIPDIISSGGIELSPLDGTDGMYLFSGDDVKRYVNFTGNEYDVVYIRIDESKYNINSSTTVGGNADTTYIGGSQSSMLSSGITQKNANLSYNMLHDIEKLKGRNGEIESTRIFGIPYHFNQYADYPLFDTNTKTVRTDNVGIGREFFENIYAEAPIVHFLPGIASFMPGVDSKDREIFNQYLSNAEAEQNKTDLASGLSDAINQKVNKIEARYYDFVPAYNEYIKYVNMLCRACAVYMGIGDRNAPGTDTKYREFNWSRYHNLETNLEENRKAEDALEDTKRGPIGKFFDFLADTVHLVADTVTGELFDDYQYIKCYVNPSSNIDTSLSNDTRDSMVKGLFDTVRDVVKEVNFFTESGSVAAGLSEIAKESISAFDEGLRTIDNGLNLGLSKLIGSAGQVLTGSNIAWPKLWDDSSYDQSYSFTIDLVSPYGDTESIYLNIIVPMMHMIALSAPRQSTANSYGHPFLVRMFAKGWGSTDLGMITDIRISKGGDGDAWTPTGLPLAAKIEITVKDLYSRLMITKSTTPAKFFQNNGLIDFLAVTCGVDVTKPNFMLKVQTLYALYTNALFDMPSNIYNSAIQKIRNSVTPIFNLTGSTM